MPRRSARQAAVNQAKLAAPPTAVLAMVNRLGQQHIHHGQIPRIHCQLPPLLQEMVLLQEPTAAAE